MNDVGAIGTEIARAVVHIFYQRGSHGASNGVSFAHIWWHLQMSGLQLRKSFTPSRLIHS